MKKKVIMMLLIVIVITTVLLGCGSEEKVSNDAMETVEMVSSSETVSNMSDIESESMVTVEETTEIVSTSVEASAEETSVDESEEETVIVETVSETVENANMQQSVQTTEELEEVKVEYTYTDMNTTMWVSSAVNVRDMPSTDGNKVGSLNSGAEVVVTGQCNETGWYRLENGNYVSGNYLSETAPVQITADNTSITQTSGESILLSAEFITILNAKRAEFGLSQVAMDANLDATALEGVKELTWNYSHRVSNENYDRCNIGHGFGQPNAQTLFDAWYGSEGHRQQMMDPYLTHIAVAYYSDGGYGIFIGNIDEDAYMQYIDEQLSDPNSDMSQSMELINSTDVGNGQTIEVYGTAGAVREATPEEEAIAEQWDWY